MVSRNIHIQITLSEDGFDVTVTDSSARQSESRMVLACFRTKATLNHSVS